MGRSVSQALLNSSSARAIAAGGPGSNGFWRREQWFRPGTFTWTAPKTGKVKVQAIGAAAGASGTRAGTSGGYGEKTFDVVQGQQYTVIVGQGGNGNISSATSGAGTTTSISGPALPQALVIPGASGVIAGNAPGSSAPIGSGPWDKTFRGAHALQNNTGSPSSASPFGDGFASSGYGGSGWGGGARNAGGGGTHGPASGNIGGPGLTTFGSAQTTGTLEQARPMWDLSDADAPGGTVKVTGSASSSIGGVSSTPAGAGAAYDSTNNSTPHSALGGGSAYNAQGFDLQKSGNGAGGCALNSNASIAGSGGDAFVQIFWDEVQ